MTRHRGKTPGDWCVPGKQAAAPPMTIGAPLRNAMLAFVTTVKLIAEIALLALLGQWVTGWLSGTARDRNPFYRVLQLIAQPWVKAVRWLAPRALPDRHLPLVAFLLLLSVWCVATVAKVRICLQIGVAFCK